MTPLKIASRFCLGLLALFTFPAAACELVISDPWIRAAPPTAKVLAAYMQLENRGDHPCIIERATSPLFGAIEIHQTVIQDGMARMIMQPGLEIPAFGQIEARPGGIHFMLMQLHRPIKESEKVPLSLETRHHGTVSLLVPVRKTARNSHDHH